MIPTPLHAEVRWSLPPEFRQAGETDWARTNARGQRLECFLEGPSFDREGHLHVVDVAFGRVFRIAPDGRWTLRAQWDGWPNGLKLHRDGRCFVADYKTGILELPPGEGPPRPVVTHHRSEGFLGVNDLFFSSQGDLWFTDQGQTGLHHPVGRVFRLDAQQRLSCVLDNVPSPNGLVLNGAETQLFGAVTRANAVWRVPLMGDGGVSKVGVFLQLSGGLAGPDGLAMDAEDGLIVAHPGIGIWRFDRVGRPTHLVEAPDGSMWTNIAFGGPAHDELHIVDSIAGRILFVRMPVPGRPLFSHA